MSECLICLRDINDKTISIGCTNPRCLVVTCTDCVGDLIKYSASQKIIPVCPSKDCDSYYILSRISSLPSETIKLYRQTCLEYMIKDSGEQMKHKIQEEEIIKKIREERKQFIISSFPAAIALVADITFTEKLGRLDKQRGKIKAKKISSSAKMCCNLTCNGILNDNYECSLCLTKFCRHCEIMLKDNHQCKQEDVESLILIQSMIKCPKCQLPVFKDQGCDSITCSNCRINFEYSTGKEGGHGSSNTKLQVPTTRKLSIEFSNKVSTEVLDLIYKIEAAIPPLIHQNILTGPILMYYKTNDAEKAGKQLAKRLDAYVRNKYQMRMYYKYLVEIENLIQEGKINPDNLNRILIQLSH